MMGCTDINIISETISGVLGAIIGLVIGYKLSVFKRTFRKAKDFFAARALRNNERISDELLNIYTIENGMPHYHKLNLYLSNYKLFVPFPDELKNEMPDGFAFRDGCSFNGSNDFGDLVDRTKIYNLKQLIDEHSILVARDFISRSKGFKFNGKLYGVYNIEIGIRETKDEKPVANILIYETDFFTFQVFKSIYYYLKGINHPISNINSLDELRQYNCFLCSMGLNIIATVESHEKDSSKIIFTKRASDVINYSNMYHISANEGVSEKDKNENSNVVSIEKCLFRALHEELGVSDEPSAISINKSSCYFNDLFFSRDLMEFGITAQVHIKNMNESDINVMIAKDRKFEMSGLFFVPHELKAINAYVAEREFVPHGLYAINTYCIRTFGPPGIELPRKKKK